MLKTPSNSSATGLKALNRSPMLAMRCKPPKSVCTAAQQRNLDLARQGQALRVLRSLDVIAAWWVGEDLQAAEQPTPQQPAAKSESNLL